MRFFTKWSKLPETLHFIRFKYIKNEMKISAKIDIQPTLFFGCLPHLFNIKNHFGNESNEISLHTNNSHPSFNPEIKLIVFDQRP